MIATLTFLQARPFGALPHLLIQLRTQPGATGDRLLIVDTRPGARAANTRGRFNHDNLHSKTCGCTGGTKAATASANDT
jgi:hypothetical protein